MIENSQEREDGFFRDQDEDEASLGSFADPPEEDSLKLRIKNRIRSKRGGALPKTPISPNLGADLKNRPSFNFGEPVGIDEGFSIWDATILLTSRAIGTGFLFFPSHQ